MSPRVRKRRCPNSRLSEVTACLYPAIGSSERPSDGSTARTRAASPSDSTASTA